MNQEPDVAHVFVEYNNEVYFLRRLDNLEYGKLDLIGGGINPGETPEEAAIREVREETGLEIRLKRKLGVFPFIYNGGRLDHVYVGEIVSGIAKITDEGKPELLTLDELASLSLDGLAFPRENCRIINQYLRGV